MKPEEKFMLKAIEAAKKSARNGDYAHGSVVVKNGKIISTGYETLKSANDPVNGHAEIDAIRKACKKLDEGYIKDCVVYTTAEPCPMCASAIYWAKAKGVVYGTDRQDMIKHMKQKGNSKFSWRQINLSSKEIFDKTIPNLNIEVVGGFMKKECVELFDLTK